MTKIYGASDDLLEFEGEIYGEIGYYGSSEKDPIKVKVSDGTHFYAFYSDEGLWKINVTQYGTHFKDLIEATNPDSDIYSDILLLNDGDLTAKYRMHESSWETVR